MGDLESVRAGEVRNSGWLSEVFPRKEFYGNYKSDGEEGDEGFG